MIDPRQRFEYAILIPEKWFHRQLLSPILSPFGVTCW